MLMMVKTTNIAMHWINLTKTRRKEILSQVNVRVEGSKWRDADSANVKVLKVFMMNAMFLLIVVTNIAEHQPWNLGVKEDANTVLTNFVSNTPQPEWEQRTSRSQGWCRLRPKLVVVVLEAPFLQELTSGNSQT